MLQDAMGDESDGGRRDEISRLRPDVGSGRKRRYSGRPLTTVSPRRTPRTSWWGEIRRMLGMSGGVPNSKVQDPRINERRVALENFFASVAEIPDPNVDPELMHAGIAVAGRRQHRPPGLEAKRRRMSALATLCGSTRGEHFCPRCESRMIAFQGVLFCTLCDLVK